MISEGQKNDIPYAIPLLKQININGSKILADRGYNSNKVLKYIHANGAKATIPSKRNAKIHKKKVQPCVTRVTPNVRLFLHKFSDQIVFCGTCDLYFYKIAGHQHLACVDKDITVNIRGIGIGSCDIGRLIRYFAFDHGI